MIYQLMRDLRAARALTRVRKLLAGTHTPLGINVWLYSQNRNLGHHSPIALILLDCPAPVIDEARRVAAE